MRFISEPDLTTSYALFCKLRPFYDQCQNGQCKIHENTQFMAEPLKKQNVISSSNLDELVSEVVCSPASRECAYDTCHECKSKKCQYSYGEDKEVSMNITYKQWVTKKVPRNDAASESQPETINITDKVEVQCTIQELVSKLQDNITVFKKHRFNIWHQYKIYKDVRDELKEHECLCHMDFSENYSCQFNNEKQSMHFGGRHKQASLHTDVYYTMNGVTPFCSISPSRLHDPAAMSVHLDPVLKQIREANPR